MDGLDVGRSVRALGWYDESWRIRIKSGWARTVKPGGEMIDILRVLGLGVINEHGHLPPGLKGGF